MCLPSSSNILFLSKSFILAHFPGCILITNGPYYCCWPGFQKAHNPHYFLLSTWLYLEWITVQIWRAHLWSWGRKTTRLRSRSRGRKARFCLIRILRWEGTLLIWTTPPSGSLNKDNERRKVALLFACLFLPCQHIHSFTGPEAYLRFQHIQKASWDTQPCRTEPLLDS